MVQRQKSNKSLHCVFIDRHLSVFISRQNELEDLTCLLSFEYNKDQVKICNLKRIKVHIIVVFFRSEGVRSDRDMWLWP